MKEIYGDIFKQDGWIVIPTNGDLDSNGFAVMGKGLAAKAAGIATTFPRALGDMIKLYGSNICFFAFDTGFLNVPAVCRFVAFQTKRSWRDKKADINLIESAMGELYRMTFNVYPQRFFVPRLGCGKGTGNLNWDSDVKPVLEKYIGDDPRFTIVTFPEEK